MPLSLSKSNRTKFDNDNDNENEAGEKKNTDRSVQLRFPASRPRTWRAELREAAKLYPPTFLLRSLCSFAAIRWRCSPKCIA